MNAGIAVAILRYIPSAIAALLADLLAYLLAPVAALPIFIRADHEGREHIAPVWQWITTHDALIDVFGRSDSDARREHWLLGRYSVAEIQASSWLRYAARIFWIWRNPAYQVSHWLGYDQRGVALAKLRDESNLWDTGARLQAFGSRTTHADSMRSCSKSNGTSGAIAALKCNLAGSCTATIPIKSACWRCALRRSKSTADHTITPPSI